jgi:hypothetical protein
LYLSENTSQLFKSKKLFKIMAARRNRGESLSDFKPSHRQANPIVVDECCLYLLRPLKNNGLRVYRTVSGLPDVEVKHLCSERGAYIITADKEFNDYENALYIYPSTKPETVFSMIKTLLNYESIALKRLSQIEQFNMNSARNPS